MEKKKLGEILISKGFINEQELMQAVEYQRKNGVRLGEALIKLEFVTEDKVLSCVSEQLKVPFIQNIKEIDMDVLLIDKVPGHMLKSNRFVPIIIKGETVSVLCNDIFNNNISDICKNIYHCSPEYFLAGTRLIYSIIDEYEREKEHKDSINKIRSGIRSQVNIYDLNAKEDSPISSEVNYIILNAYRKRASDIHLVQQEGGASIQYRIDGMLHLISTCSIDMSIPLVSVIKNMSQILSTEKRRAQDGSFKALADGISVDVRVSTMPTVYGESVVIRLLDHRYIDFLSVDDLAFSSHNKERYNYLTSNPNGIFAVTGPTGSGKSTTNYITLNQMNTGEKSIHSIEDPVEYRMKGVVSTQINAKAGVTFASCLRTLVRQDPDIIYIGEIRDQETASMAINAANTGQFILTTLHTNDSVSSISRLLNLGVKPYQIVDAFLGATAQVLARRVHKQCNGEGCGECNNTGYYGRIPLQEVMILSPNMKDVLISSEASHLNELRRIAIKEGLVTMFEDGMEKVSLGITTEEEVLRVVRNTNVLSDVVRREGGMCG